MGGPPTKDKKMFTNYDVTNYNGQKTKYIDCYFFIAFCCLFLYIVYACITMVCKKQRCVMLRKIEKIVQSIIFLLAIAMGVAVLITDVQPAIFILGVLAGSVGLIALYKRIRYW